MGILSFPLFMGESFVVITVTTVLSFLLGHALEMDCDATLLYTWQASTGEQARDVPTWGAPYPRQATEDARPHFHRGMPPTGNPRKAKRQPEFLKSHRRPKQHDTPRCHIRGPRRTMISQVARRSTLRFRQILFDGLRRRFNDTLPVRSAALEGAPQALARRSAVQHCEYADNKHLIVHDVEDRVLLDVHPPDTGRGKRLNIDRAKP